MVKKVDSQSLGIVNRALGLTGMGSPETEFLDGIVEQTLDVGPLIRRGRALADTSGIFTPTLRNIHTDSESLFTSVDPYAVGATAAIAPYPARVPESFDVWLLGASVRRVSGGGTINATLSLDVGTRNAGFGIDDSGVAVLSSESIRLAYWNSIVTVGTAFALLQALGPHQRIGIRIPRNVSLLRFDSFSSLTVTYDCQMIIGLFPIGLGQDAIG